jgi:N-acetylmuramoyl-L-alanine amidase
MPKICLDAGHYARCNWNKNVTPVYWESLMAWDLHLMLKEELEKYENITVVTTRKEQEKGLDLTARGRCAIGCDLFLSLHSNACDSESVDRAVVIYPVSGKERSLADALSVCISEVMQLKDKPQIYFRWNSKNNADYYGVIRGAASVGVPGLILEHSFHTHNKSAIWLQNKNNLRKLAIAEAAVIAKRFDCKLKNEATDKPLAGATSKYKLPYRVKIGAFNNIQNALNMYQLAHDKGFDQAYIEDANGTVVMF